MAEGKGLALHWQILIGMAVGLVVGLVLNLVHPSLAPHLSTTAADGTVVPTVLGQIAGIVTSLNGFVGDLFLRLLRFIAVPIVLFSLIVGASSLNDLRKLSRIGGRTIAIYVGTTALAISTGLLFANVAQPGTWVPQATRDALATKGADAATAKMATAVAPDVWQTLLDVVPANPFAALAQAQMLQVVCAALIVGAMLTLIPEEKAKPVIDLADGLNDAVLKLVDLVMRLAPLAVFALIARVIAQLGADVLGALLVYSLTVVAGLAVMMFVVYPAILWGVTRIRLGRFFEAIAPAQLLAFSSSSSSATLPVTMECVEERLGVGEDVTSFVIPLGATINMDGTALYQGVAALFIAQMYGIDLTLSDQLTIVLTATLASIGTAGVPGVGLIMLVIVLQSVGMPNEVMTGGIAIIFGVDRLLDMCRTSCNVTGDAMVATVVAHLEGDLVDEVTVAQRLEAKEAAGVDENP